jgi:hypothetical protein
VNATTTTHKCYPTETSVNARIRRQTLRTVLALAALTGHSDGETWATCVGCGNDAHVGGSPRANNTLNLGHVNSDADGGVWCVCNFLPLCRTCNQEMGKATLTDVLVPVHDNRSEWDGKLMADTGAVVMGDDKPRGMGAWKRPEGV